MTLSNCGTVGVVRVVAVGLLAIPRGVFWGVLRATRSAWWGVLRATRFSANCVPGGKVIIGLFAAEGGAFWVGAAALIGLENAVLGSTEGAGAPPSGLDVEFTVHAAFTGAPLLGEVPLFRYLWIGKVFSATIF